MAVTPSMLASSVLPASWPVSGCVVGCLVDFIRVRQLTLALFCFVATDWPHMVCCPVLAPRHLSFLLCFLGRVSCKPNQRAVHHAFLTESCGLTRFGHRFHLDEFILPIINGPSEGIHLNVIVYIVMYWIGT